jgi:transcription antitermination factor NusB
LISSRRLAREWALKILYQSDVGKMSVEESQAAALDRLRREFVQRSSRSAAGSLLEEDLVAAITTRLQDLLPEYDSALEAALRACMAQLFRSGEFWLELGLSFTISRQSFNALWSPPRTASQVVLPSSLSALPPAVLANSRISTSLRQRLLEFIIWARESLPEIAMRAYGREIQRDRPEGASLVVTHEYASERWRRIADRMSERWAAAGHAAEKQTFDWMRVAAFTLRLVTGVCAHLEELDRSLQELEIGWALDRQVSVDRNILRMAAFELSYLEGVPASATINEAVELAKKYSTAESGRFVNGILGAIVTQGGRHPGSEVDDEADRGEVEIADTEVDLDEIPSEEELSHV